mmetsp:Transcript_12437/g.43531  ORF Transcript_12437/g.43531 Transcript_12437/m.43531 type:complete len:218 (+) Transcript_12437:855-1508(+)
MTRLACGTSRFTYVGHGSVYNGPCAADQALMRRCRRFRNRGPYNTASSAYSSLHRSRSLLAKYRDCVGSRSASSVLARAGSRMCHPARSTSSSLSFRSRTTSKYAATTRRIIARGQPVATRASGRTSSSGTTCKAAMFAAARCAFKSGSPPTSWSLLPASSESDDAVDADSSESDAPPCVSASSTAPVPAPPAPPAAPPLARRANAPATSLCTECTS